MSDKIDWKTARFRLREALDDEDSNGSDDDLKQNGLDGTPVLKDASNAHQMDQVETESEDAGDSDDEIDWETDRFQLNENDDNISKTNQNDTIDSTDAESNTDAVADFDNVRLRQMVRQLKKMIDSLDGAKRQDKRSIAHRIENMLKDIKNMIHTWVSDGTEMVTEDELSSANDGDNGSREICLRTHAKLRNWIKKLKNITYFMDSDTSDSDTGSSSDSDDDANSPYECTYLPGKRARRS